jgi:ribosome biogenesis protein MAK21
MKTSLHQNKGRQQERMQHRKKMSKFSGRTLQKPAYPFDPKNFLFSSNGLWFENAKFLPKVPHIEDTKLDTKSILEKKTHAKNLYDSQVAKFDQGQDKNSLVDKEWLKTVLHSGTSSDKIAAITLRIQSAPFYRLQALDMLLNSARKKGRRESEMAIEALKDLFINNLLPSHRKLISFQKRPLSRSEVTEPHLIFWYFEDAVKIRFAEFVKILEQGSRDTILNYRQKMLKFAFELLCEKPEQEQQLLTLVINKLGDPERKLASKVIHYLNLLLMRHPKMKLVVAKEVEVFLRRPNLSSRAQYYAILFLNQIILTRQNIELSQKLIQIYFQMFKVLIGQKHDVESKMLSALLTGVNRAFPFARVAPEAFQEELDTLFRIVHIATFNKSIQALLLIFQVLRAQGVLIFPTDCSDFYELFV